MSKNEMHRRGFLGRLAVVFGSSVALPTLAFGHSKAEEVISNPVKNIKALGFTWETLDPFLFCVHHEDDFPKGNDQMGVDPKYYSGRHLGDDFIVKDGFRMYHGQTVPGFPGHPHRGFETITVVRKGIVDHSDSLGASGRYGNGDVQWMTAGKGVQHAEMFPLIHKERGNPMELFQIWLNLPRANKMVDPHYKMLWKEDIGIYNYTDANKKKTQIEVIAGAIDNVHSPGPTPNSWANDPKNEVAIWNMQLEAGAIYTLPKASKGINRTIYFYEGDFIHLNDQKIDHYHSVELIADMEVTIKTGQQAASILLLQGRPINEPVIQYGPFVMNTKQEIQQAFDDYHKDQFGGWPWPKADQVHDRSKRRFAKYADGRVETKNA